MTDACKRFYDSTRLDYERWREGTSYDLAALDEASADEREAILGWLVARQPMNWRDAEALAHLGGPRAEERLRAALRVESDETRMSILRFAPHLAEEDERTSQIVRSIRSAEIFGGLSQTLLRVEEHHPPEVIDALMMGSLQRPGDVATHLAAMAMYLHGKAAEPFDWAHRPLFLRFNTADRAERVAAFQELCRIIGVDPAPFLRRILET